MTKPVMTVTMVQTPRTDLLVSGIVEDQDLFRNVPFASFNEALNYLLRKYHAHYRVVLNVPPRKEQ